MAAASMGAFGTYKLQYHRHLLDLQAEEKRRAQGGGPDDETVWVTRRYNPQDLRVLAPVPRHKLIVPKVRPLPLAEQHWIPVTDPPLRSFQRDREPVMFASYASTRCEDWSTLRQMLPSRGSAHKVRPPSWGMGQGLPPNIFPLSAGRLPHFNSPMTR